MSKGKFIAQLELDNGIFRVAVLEDDSTLFSFEDNSGKVVETPYKLSLKDLSKMLTLLGYVEESLGTIHFNDLEVDYNDI